MGDRAATIKEGLLVELFRDADTLIERLEGATEGIGDKLHETQRAVGELANTAAATLSSSASAEREKWSREARAVTSELQKVATGVTGQANGMLLLCAAVGVAGGAIGGLVVAIVFKLV